jgi:hypothetical protein
VTTWILWRLWLRAVAKASLGNGQGQLPASFTVSDSGGCVGCGSIEAEPYFAKLSAAPYFPSVRDHVSDIGLPPTFAHWPLRGI